MRALLLVVLAAVLAGCDARKSYRVDSKPPGAEVLVDGQLMGVTPTSVLLDPTQEGFGILLRKPGYRPFETRVTPKPLLEGPTQRCTAVACSPCCLFLPLALCYEQTFVPRRLEAVLERAGQGLEVVCRPIGAQVWVDGVLLAQTEASEEETEEGGARVRSPSDYGVATVMLEPRVVKVEIRAEGYLTKEFQVQIRPEEYVHLRLDLARKE